MYESVGSVTWPRHTVIFIVIVGSMVSVVWPLFRLVTTFSTSVLGRIDGLCSSGPTSSYAKDGNAIKAQ